MQPEIQLIVCDLDGTLLNSQHRMSRRTEIALKAAMRRGVPLIIATGKTRHSARKIIQQLNLSTPGVFIQGLTVYTGNGAILAETTLDSEVAQQIFAYGERHNFIPLAYTRDRILVRAENAEVNRGFLKYDDPIPEAHPQIERIFKTTPIHKVIYLGKPDAIQNARHELNRQLNSKIQLTQAGIPEMLEILPGGASKGYGVKQALDYLKTDPQDVMAIGDGENDIEMLKMVGFGVAMENAGQQVKAIADYITLSNDNDGVAHAVEQFVLKREPR